MYTGSAGLLAAGLFGGCVVGVLLGQTLGQGPEVAPAPRSGNPETQQAIETNTEELVRIGRELSVHMVAIRNSLDGSAPAARDSRRVIAEGKAPFDPDEPAAKRSEPETVDPDRKPPQLEQLKELLDKTAQPERRSEWLFASEKTALRRFGLPDRVHMTQGGERWQYTDASGRTRKSYYLYFMNGRLISWMGP